MKKILAGLLLTGVVLAPVTTFAAIESDVSVNFAGDDINKGDGPYADSLSLTFAPKSFAFNQRTVSTTGNNFKLESGHQDKQWVVVNDNRSDNNLGKGWDVSVQMGKFLEDTKNTPLQLDADLTMKLAPVVEYFIGDKWATDANGKKDLVPNEPNESNATKPFATTPQDILLGGTTTGEYEMKIEAAKVGSSDDWGEKQMVIKQSDRALVDAKQEGWATKVSDQTLNFATLKQAEVSGKAFKTKLIWTLNKNA